MQHGWVKTLGWPVLALTIVACAPTAPVAPPVSSLPATAQLPALAPAQGEIIGTGPVRVALILPLSGSAAGVGQSMANGARLAIEQTPSPTIHLVLKDAGSSAETARNATQQALAEGAELILGPLTADSVALAGAIARSYDTPLIGFSSTSSVATDGVYLLSVLPEAEIMRALGFARAQGRNAIAAIVPDTPLGHAQAEALRQAAGETGMRIVGVEMFADEAQARRAVERLAPAMRSNLVDALYLPDAATAPSFGILLEAARVPRQRILVIGAGEWEGNPAIAAQAYLAGAVYPAIDPTGLAALSASYRQRFGGEPHQLATLAYSAVLVANTPSLSLATPPFGNSLFSPTGFTGRDGPLRFHFDGRGEYGLVMRQVAPGGAATIEAAKLGGLPLASNGGIGMDAGIPPAAEFR
ncbi:penicillin-binding protein activator [Pelagibacterium sp. 26DY04]|uniref:penicillin-binding protein activator n=1 Tax=Pelagibacterium sp. 26DY04 TaxID=2967130 RepID=UPI00281648F0|nr:penicillin-binding protein activator [Pelagibacterium sp. 26DY04]WMT87018.1 penicillin-binding protein activator [Pelagibacterium sp. 26DY04]